MSAQPVPFPASARVIRLTVTASAPTAVQLPNAGNQIRMVSHGSDAYIAIADTQAAAVATVPTAAASVTSMPILGGSDIIQSIPSGSIQWISGILDAGASGTTFIDVMVGEGI